MLLDVLGHLARQLRRPAQHVDAIQVIQHDLTHMPADDLQVGEALEHISKRQADNLYTRLVVPADSRQREDGVYLFADSGVVGVCGWMYRGAFRAEATSKIGQ